MRLEKSKIGGGTQHPAVNDPRLLASAVRPRGIGCRSNIVQLVNGRDTLGPEPAAGKVHVHHRLNRKHSSVQLIFKDRKVCVLPPSKVCAFVETGNNIVHEIQDTTAWGTSISFKFRPAALRHFRPDSAYQILLGFSSEPIRPRHVLQFGNGFLG